MNKIKLKLTIFIIAVTVLSSCTMVNQLIDFFPFNNDGRSRLQKMVERYKQSSDHKINKISLTLEKIKIKLSHLIIDIIFQLNIKPSTKKKFKFQNYRYQKRFQKKEEVDLLSIIYQSRLNLLEQDIYQKKQNSIEYTNSAIHFLFSNFPEYKHNNFYIRNEEKTKNAKVDQIYSKLNTIRDQLNKTVFPFPVEMPSIGLFLHYQKNKEQHNSIDKKLNVLTYRLCHEIVDLFFEIDSKKDYRRRFYIQNSYVSNRKMDLVRELIREIYSSKHNLSTKYIHGTKYILNSIKKTFKQHCMTADNTKVYEKIQKSILNAIKLFIPFFSEQAITDPKAIKREIDSEEKKIEKLMQKYDALYKDFFIFIQRTRLEVKPDPESILDKEFDRFYNNSIQSMASDKEYPMPSDKEYSMASDAEYQIYFIYRNDFISFVSKIYWNNDLKKYQITRDHEECLKIGQAIKMPAYFSLQPECSKKLIQNVVAELQARANIAFAQYKMGKSKGINLNIKDLDNFIVILGKETVTITCPSGEKYQTSYIPFKPGSNQPPKFGNKIIKLE